MPAKTVPSGIVSPIFGSVGFWAMVFLLTVTVRILDRYQLRKITHLEWLRKD
jgi:hypothetical protein